MSNRRTTRRLARRDGQVVHVKACCDIEVTIGTGRVSVAHDDGCPALDPSTVDGRVARGVANVVVGQVLAGVIDGNVVVIRA